MQRGPTSTAYINTYCAPGTWCKDQQAMSARTGLSMQGPATLKTLLRSCAAGQDKNKWWGVDMTGDMCASGSSQAGYTLLRLNIMNMHPPKRCAYTYYPTLPACSQQLHSTASSGTRHIISHLVPGGDKK